MTETMRSKRKPIYILYVDLSKAYDTIPREALWEVLDKMEITGTLCEMIKLMYAGNTAQVKLFDGTESHPFNLLNGIKQGCSLSCSLFNGVIDTIIRATLEETCPGVTISWRIPKGRNTEETLQKAKTN